MRKYWFEQKMKRLKKDAKKRKARAELWWMLRTIDSKWKPKSIREWIIHQVRCKHGAHRILPCHMLVKQNNKTIVNIGYFRCVDCGIMIFLTARQKRRFVEYRKSEYTWLDQIGK